ncbi:MAG: cation transporting ATPase C-terminal domain-containing protein, partial [Oscillospiraceae bacterium]|nr:cation transporting ATPase C-terminal domain-containing protein [Oscillospiraceae bacterium]
AVISFFFAGNFSDSKNTLRPSDFIGKNIISRDFLFGTLIQGMSLFAVSSIMFLVFRENEAESVRSIILTIFVTGILSMAWVGLSYENPFYVTFSEAVQRLRKGSPSFAIMLTGGILLFLILAVYLPFSGAAFGLEAVSPLVFIMSVLVGAASQLWFDFVKRRFYN